MKTKEENENLLFDNSSITEKKNEETIAPVEPVVTETITETPAVEPSAETPANETTQQEPAATGAQEVSKVVETTPTVTEEHDPEAPENETPEQKRERKKGSGRKPLPRDPVTGEIIREVEPVKKNNGKKDLTDLLDQYKDDKPAAPVTPAAPLKPQLDVSKFINGAVFLIVMDAVFPSLILFLMEMMNPKYGHVKEAARKKLKLDKDEKALLEEGANEIVKYIFADANPIFVFAISVGFIYYGKIDALEDEDFNKPIRKEKQPVHGNKAK